MLTMRQLETLEAIRNLTRETGKPPTYREIAWETGLHLGSLYHIVQRLEERGHLKRSRYRRRALTLAKSTSSTQERAAYFIFDEKEKILRRLRG